MIHVTGQAGGREVYKVPEDVVKAILRMEAAGECLKYKYVYNRHGKLHYAAVRLLGSWAAALRAGGLDSEVIFNRRKWTAERLIKTICDLHRRGTCLNYGAAVKADYGLVQAAAKCFGSWAKALQAAGFDPDSIRVNRRPWRREEIIELIRTRHAQGLPIACHNVVPASAEIASRRLFGSWRAAIKAAGVPNPSVRFPVWTKVSVVEGILARQQAGQPIYAFAAARQAPRLYDAARRLFGRPPKSGRSPINSRPARRKTAGRLPPPAQTCEPRPRPTSKTPASGMNAPPAPTARPPASGRWPIPPRRRRRPPQRTARRPTRTNPTRASVGPPVATARPAA